MGMMQPAELPDGVWQSLFQSALTLVEEIRKHGNPDPFFTFGGGTVLMLRHQHRLSKDIDLFVPDPQSLGFVNPRLNDIAETLCNSQYVEAATYIKLQLENGEIDFVASPNLLPAAHAFERWDLFGQSVRVETSAEIVAKKMFHRGDKSTARDLFDLALVIEREPEAMAVVQPFFFRHAEAFITNLTTPTDRFISQFKDIRTLNYQPTFDHATQTALAYFQQMNSDLSKSKNSAEEFAEINAFNANVPNLNRSEHIGAVLMESSHHIVQHIGPGRVIIHEKHKLPLNQRYQIGESQLRIRYRDGFGHTIANSRAKDPSR
jgi:predicted nucleotidyltransferase component of viral defense system